MDLAGSCMGILYVPAVYLRINKLECFINGYIICDKFISQKQEDTFV